MENAFVVLWKTVRLWKTGTVRMLRASASFVIFTDDPTLSAL
jgi:hypothetical protein